VLHRAFELASRAPSAHNTQPWQVEVGTDGRLQVRADPSRLLTHTDPSSRDVNVALGAFTEALVIALGVEGLLAEHVEPSADAFSALRVRPDATRTAPSAELASLLRRRQTSRLAYSPRPLPTADLEALAQTAKQHGLELHLSNKGSSEHRRVGEWLFAASRESWLDLRATRELRRWVHFDPEGLRPTEDGLTTHCLGLSPLEGVALLALLRDGPWRALSTLFVAPVLAEQLARQDVVSFERAPSFGLLVAPPGMSDVASGGAVLRCWLEATKRGLVLHPQSVLLDRRGWEVGRLLSIDPRRVKLAFRLGHSVPAPWSGRLPVERFAIYRG
jgi:hypothetical protein